MSRPTRRVPSVCALAAARVRSSVAGGLAVLIALTAAGCTSVAAPRVSDPGLPATTTGTASTATSPTTGTTAVVPEDWAARRQREVVDMVVTRFAAAGAADADGWLAPLREAPTSPLRTAQASILDRMTRMGAGDFRLVTARETRPPVPSPAGTPVEWSVRVSLTFRLRGFDSAPRAFDLDLTLQADPAEPDGLRLTGSTPSRRPQPWDLAGLVVRRSSTALVLAVGSSRHVDEVVARARHAQSRVAAVWGSARPAVWVAPATDADAARLLGRSAAGLAGVAAATDGPLAPGQPAGADRIVLVPKVWTALRPEGRDVVLTHELTHATVRASTTRAVPVWLSEGFADLVAYRLVDLPEATLVAPALERARRTGRPRSLPPDADFDPGSLTLPAAYALSLLAVRSLADAQGIPAVVRVYRAASGGLEVPTSQVGDPEAVVDTALRSGANTTRAALVLAWQARIGALLR